jgi:pyrroloquinoline quinone (PQQ) biosynthesis protein C
MEERDSWRLIHDGTAAEFVVALKREAAAHPAVHHPYLKRLAAGDLPRIDTALRDYAFQYRFYGAEFPSYLEGVIGSLKSDQHRSVLRQNLAEEKGDPESDDRDKMPHTRLFGLFGQATGVDAEYLDTHEPCTTVMIWRDLFLQKCQSRQEGVALGAIGIATELLVPDMYRYILQGIREHTDLTENDAYFFALHSRCDEAHAAALLDITIELADRRDLREAIRFGVISALNLRRAFWDVMLSRAVKGLG